MNILLINCPVRLNARPNCIPYGVATIAATLRDRGFNVDIYDINGLRHNQRQVANQLEKGKWDIFGVSGLITTYAYQKWLINRIKKDHPASLVVSGGGLATSVKETLLNTILADILVIGEGEQTMLELCLALETGCDLSQVPGIIYRENGHLIKTGIRKNRVNLNDIPFPAWDLLPMDIYLKNRIWGDSAHNSSGFKNDVKISRSMNIIASRGCPFSCRYCYNIFGPSSYRIRSPQNIMKEISILVKEYGVDFIGFVDDNLMSSKSHILELCGLIKYSDLQFKWGCHGRVNSAVPEVLNEMAEAGCVWIGYGIESGSQKILGLMNKKVSVKQAEQAIINTRKAGIFANTTFIFGYPGETHQTIQETINFKKKLDIQCGSFFATPYPGTAFYQEIKSSIRDESAYIEKLGDATQFIINLTQFDDQTLLKLKTSMDHNVDVVSDSNSSPRFHHYLQNQST